MLKLTKTHMQSLQNCNEPKFWDTKIFYFPFGTAGKLIILNVQILKHISTEDVQANLSYLLSSLTEETGWIRQVVRIDRLKKNMEKLNRLGFLAGLGWKS